MFKDITKFKDISSFIDHIKTKDYVVGIVEYGGRTHDNMSLGGDYDLTIIFNKPVSSNATGIHFHIAGIPVDCMILSIDDFLTETPSNEFLLVHLNCKLLFDRNNITKNLLDNIKQRWNTPSELSDCEVSTFRFTFQHVLDKLQHRLFDNELYSRYFIFSSLDWFLQCYARIKNMEVGKPRVHLSYIKSNDLDLYNTINCMYNTTDLRVQFESLRECANRMLITIGGLWRDDEILFHIAPKGKNIEEEQKSLVSMLFE